MFQVHSSSYIIIIIIVKIIIIIIVFIYIIIMIIIHLFVCLFFYTWVGGAYDDLTKTRQARLSNESFAADAGKQLILSIALST